MAEKPRIRVPARSATVLAPNRARASYEGASTSDRSLRWGAGTSSAYASLQASAFVLRGRSYKAHRNFSVARSAIRRQVDAVIGVGAVPRLKGLDPTLSKSVLSLFETWATTADADGATDFYGQQAQIVEEMFLGGDGLVRFRYRFPQDGYLVPLQLECLTGDFLPENEHRMNGQNTIRSGIEITPFGKRERYWLYSSNPRDTLGAWRLPGSMVPVPVPAEQICHVRLPGLTGQMRGEPLLAAALTKLADLDDYDDAELLRKRNAAAITGFIRRPTDNGRSNMEQLAEEAEEGIGSLSLEPGAFPVLAPGEEVTLAGTTDVGGQYESFLRWQLRFVAMAVGCPYEALTGDWSQSSDRAYRAAMLEWRRWCDRVRHQVLVPQLLRPVWRAFVETSVLSGALRLPPGVSPEVVIAAVEWRFPAWGWVNPVQEVQAYRLAIRAGITTREAVVAELGYDIEEIDEALARDQARADALGLVLDIDPRRVSGTGVTQARPAGSTDPNATSLSDIDPNPNPEA